MKFTYNDIGIGTGATGTGANTTIQGKPDWKWSFSMVTWSVEFTKDTATEAKLREFDQKIRSTTDGLTALSKDFVITYDDGTEDSFEEEPGGEDPTGVNMNPTVEAVNGPFTSSTFARYRFTIEWEIPTVTFNGVKMLQVASGVNAIGLQVVTIQGLIPSRFLNGTHDAIRAFDQYFKNNVRKSVLNTFLGDSYYKKIQGPDITSEKGLAAMSKPVGARWNNCNFTVKYEQVAFPETESGVVSTHIVNPTITVTQIADIGGEMKLPSPAGAKGGGSGGKKSGEAKKPPGVGGQATARYAVSFDCWVSLDSDYLNSGTKSEKAKRKGFEADVSGLTKVYFEEGRKLIVKYLKSIYGGGDVALYNETVTYTNEPRISVQAFAFPSKNKNVYTFDSYSINTTSAQNFKILNGQDFSMLRIQPGAIATATFNRTILSKSLGVTLPTLGGWKIDVNSTSNARIAGGIYSSNSGGRIDFTPLYETTMALALTYAGSGSRTNVISGGSEKGGDAGGGGKMPAVGGYGGQ